MMDKGEKDGIMKNEEIVDRYIDSESAGGG